MIRRSLPLLVLLLALPAWAQEAPTPAAPEAKAAPEAAPEPKVEPQAAPEPKAAPLPAKIWFFTATDKGDQGPVDTAELRELMKIKVVDGGTPLRRQGQQVRLFPGDVAELTDLVKWHFMLRGQKTGPVDTARLKKLVQLGVLTAQSEVWRPGMARWKGMGEVVELGGVEKAAPVGVGAAEEDEVDPRMGRLFVTIGVQAGGNVFSTSEGMGMAALGGRVSVVYLANPTFHLGIHATYTNLDGGGMDEPI